MLISQQLASIGNGLLLGQLQLGYLPKGKSNMPYTAPYETDTI